MGACTQRPKNLMSSITVATLNYCGIMNSPFQFYCDDYLNQLKEIGNHFLEIIPLYFPDFNRNHFKWKFGKIDVKFRNRYSPMFFLNVGLINNVVMSQRQFEEKWEEEFSSKITQVKVQYTPEQKDVMLKYDIAMWHTLLRYVYGIKKLREAAGLKNQKYIAKLKPMYDLSFLDEERKSLKVQQNLKRIKADVIFFQQYSQGFFEAVTKKGEFYYSHDPTNDTLILAKKSSFKSQPESNEIFLQSKMGKQLWQKFNWCNRTSLMIIDNIIFLNVHLKSKQEQNKEQVEVMKKVLPEFKKKMSSYEIVLAGDLNSYVAPFNEELYFFPNREKQITTVKKRTYTQGQFHKAQKVIRQSKDKIISTRKITGGKISYITGEPPSDQNLVPTNQHPFDHFVVSARLFKQASN